MGVKEKFEKFTSGVKTGVKAIGNKFKEGFDKVKAKAEFNKLEKKKQAYIISEFEKQAHSFTIYFKNGKTKKVKSLYDFDNKILRIYDEINKEKVTCLKDIKNQEYFIQEIDLNGDCFKCEYEGEELTLPLEKIIFTNTKPVAPVINNYVDNSIHDDHSIKTKNSNINSNGSSVDTKNDLGVHVHLPKP